MTSRADDPIFHDFYHETEEIVEELETILFEVEKGSSCWEEHKGLLMRNLHSIKGASGMFGLIELSEFVHYIEDELKDGEPRVEFISYLLDQLPIIKAGVLDDKVKFIKFHGEHHGLHQAKAVIDKNDERKVQNAKKTVPGTPKEIIDLVFIEDDPIFLMQLKKYFSERYRCEFCTNITEGINAFERFRFKVLISDIKLPETEGTIFLEFINKQKLNIPTIMMSSTAEKEDYINRLETPSFSFVHKPIKSSQLDLEIKDALVKWILNDPSRAA